MIGLLLERAEPQDAPSSGRSQLFLKGMVVQLLNPKITIFTLLAVLPTAPTCCWQARAEPAREA